MQQFDLSRAELEETDEILKSFEVVGDRYGGHYAAMMNG